MDLGKDILLHIQILAQSFDTIHAFMLLSIVFVFSRGSFNIQTSGKIPHQVLKFTIKYPFDQNCFEN